MRKEYTYGNGYISNGLLAEDFISRLVSCSDEFRSVKEKYDETLETLQKVYGEDNGTSTKEVIGAIEKQITIEILYSWNLGFWANYEHFKDPVARTFMDVDPEEYLREAQMRAMPQYLQSEAAIKKFYDMLGDYHKELFDAVFEYRAFIDTVVPKLAHYLGYLSANELLSYTEPGYVQDTILSIEYRRFLESLDPLFGSFIDTLGNGHEEKEKDIA